MPQLCLVHSSAAEEGRAAASGNSTDQQPSLEEVTELSLGFENVKCQCLENFAMTASLSTALHKWILTLFLQTHNFCSRGFGLVFPLQR